MGVLDTVKSQAELVANKAKESVQEVQLRRELGKAYEELGRTTFELADAGRLTHERLTPIVQRIRDATARLQEHAPAPRTEEEQRPEPAEHPPARTMHGDASASTSGTPPTSEPPLPT